MAIRSEYTTQKGTVLPLMNLKGKEYMGVQHRMVWFREEKSDWSFETEFVTLTDTLAVAKATIKDNTGRIIATAHKQENVKGFADFIEKAETGAIGRALLMCGYGTAFAVDELDEGERLADTPVASVKAPAAKPALPSTTPDPGGFKRTIGAPKTAPVNGVSTLSGMVATNGVTTGSASSKVWD